MLAKLSIQHATPSLAFLLYKLNEQPKPHSFFLHEAEANQVPKHALPDPKTGFFVIIVVSIISTASRFVSDIGHLVFANCNTGPQGAPEATGVLFTRFKKSRLQICRLLLPVLLESLPCILLVVEVNVVDMI